MVDVREGREWDETRERRQRVCGQAGAESREGTGHMAWIMAPPIVGSAKVKEGP